MASMQKRLQKELLALQNDPPPGMTLNEKSVQNSITQSCLLVKIFLFILMFIAMVISVYPF
ncbi:ubiquitin conjugating enzyme E2 W [Homo sapiens]|uniref:Ubiquitin conjugating enzyme E2 W n=1 Tax=Homo sapiens TaxID=9606 RepID=E5RG25_HUMAN|nr:ubiquitin conjugating enzyme E2 W [Homo sapiens]KAI2550324.1 ubiquitin conjugating enzyme E2 W [Homo sapiens]KAI2550325.1 ubiquitin conjugating enzyme E2 W [Homo sapiens]KAI4010964.1 ubiquitin conjugating enzyme E2 W [Homo sapiens]KAI4010967.1 ubiquitin conjugating enzyme E2 W [Homo sapiens]